MRAIVLGEIGSCCNVECCNRRRAMTRDTTTKTN